MARLQFPSVVATPANEQTPAISRDGKWLTYTSDESGRYASTSRRSPVPAGSGRSPTAGRVSGGWLGNGNEVFQVRCERAGITSRSH